MRDLRTRARAASIVSSVLILSVGLVPTAANAADHLDSMVVAANGRTDITDVYAFSGPGGNASVFVIGINPGAGVLANSTTSFGSKVTYKLKIDTNGDNRAEIKFVFKFGRPNGSGLQTEQVWKNDVLVASGWTGSDISVTGGGRTRAGLFDDPFYFDLDAFKGQVLGNGNGRTFCDSNTHDFFLGLNIDAIILRVPNSELGGDGKTIGVWASTEDSSGKQIDQMGRPAINTVFNNTTMDQSDRQLFNETRPAKMVGSGFRAHVKDVLTALGAADPNGLSQVLIPDVLTYQTGNLGGFLNGRRLTDDVIDAELNLVTNGGIATDCISNDSQFRNSWPFLAPAN